MIVWLFLLFTVGPVVELYLLIKVGGLIGALPTVAIVLVTGAVGASLARWQGLAALQEIRSAMDAGRVPGAELLQGFLVLAGGLLLVTPGLITDAVGLLLLVPPVRRLVAAGLTRYFRRRIVLHVSGMDGVPGPGSAAGRTVDADFRPGEPAAPESEPGSAPAEAPPSLTPPAGDGSGSGGDPRSGTR